MVDNTFELFCDLEASDEQCDFPVVYASGVQGIAGDDPKNMADTLAPLFDTIVREIKPPLVKIDAPLQLLVGSQTFGNFAESKHSLHQAGCGRLKGCILSASKAPTGAGCTQLASLVVLPAGQPRDAVLGRAAAGTRSLAVSGAYRDSVRCCAKQPCSAAVPSGV